MKTASGALISLLAGKQQFAMADLYTITLVTGTILRYTSLDIDVAWGGNTFLSRGLLIARGELSWKVGVSVDKLDLTLTPTTATIGGIAFAAAVRNGALDGAWVKLERLFFSGAVPPLTAVDAMTLFYGRVSEIPELTGTQIHLSIANILILLNADWPRNKYSSTCNWPLYSSGCGLIVGDWTVAGTTNPSSTVLRVTTRFGGTFDDGYFDNGVIAFTSGNCTGALRTIRSYASAIAYVSAPLPAVPQSGDTFTIYPGCDHTKGMCDTKFGNVANFRGFPYIPCPETSI